MPAPFCIYSGEFDDSGGGSRRVSVRMSTMCTREDRTGERRDFAAFLQYVDDEKLVSTSPAALDELNAAEASLCAHLDDAGPDRPSNATLNTIRPGTVVSVRVGGEALTCRVDQLLSSRLEATLLSIPASPINRATWIRGDGLVFLKRNVITVHA